MKFLYPLFISLILAFSACEGLEKIDSDFKINPLSDPESALRCFFLAGDSSVRLEVSQKPEADVPSGKNYGIKLVSGNKIDVEYNVYSTVQIALDSLTPSTAKIKNIYITSAASEGSYWNCEPLPRTLEVRNFKFTISTTVKSSTFPIKVWAKLQDTSKDSTTGAVKTVDIVVPEKVLTISLK
jgi:hypothetical protein